MNTYDQLKAKIVKHCPELLELSFGCEVVVIWSQDDHTSSCHATVLDRDDWKGWLRVFNYTLGCNKVAKEADLLEILGHEPQLQHVLRAIMQKKKDLKGFSEEVVIKPDGELKYCWVDDRLMEAGGGTIKYDLTKPLKDQSPETLEWLNSVIE